MSDATTFASRTADGDHTAPAAEPADNSDITTETKSATAKSEAKPVVAKITDKSAFSAGKPVETKAAETVTPEQKIAEAASAKPDVMAATDAPAAPGIDRQGIATG